MLNVRRLTAAMLAMFTLCNVGLAARASEPIAPLVSLQRQLARYTQTAPGRVALMIEDLTTGRSTSINGNRAMPAASTIKIPVMIEVFKHLAAGAFDLDRHVTLQPADRDDGWGDLAQAPSGSRYSVAQLLELMITESDNTATNMLIRLVGRQAINRSMHRLGCKHTYLADVIRSNGPIRQALRTSPGDMIHLLDAMAREQLVDQWSSREMIAIMDRQHHNTLLPAPLPAGTTIAHKTGSLSDTLNDVGIVYLASNPYAIAVMTTELPTLDAGRQFIRHVSRLAYDQFAQYADWRRDSEPLASIPDPQANTTQSPDIRMWEPLNAGLTPSPETTPAQPAPAPTPSS